MDSPVCALRLSEKKRLAQHIAVTAAAGESRRVLRGHREEKQKLSVYQNKIRMWCYVMCSVWEHLQFERWQFALIIFYRNSEQEFCICAHQVVTAL